IELWTELRDEARRNMQKELRAPIIGADVHGDAIAHAMRNARAAGIGHLTQFCARDFRNFTPPAGPPGTLLCNPPYGERIGTESELVDLYSSLGEVLRARWGGWRAYVFTGNPRLAARLGAPIEERALFNGKIPCRLLRFNLS